MKGLRSFGIIGSVFLCGALFSLYHANPVQTIYQFVCGLAFAFMAVKSGSILPTVLSHFLNNTMIILLTKFGVSSIPTAVIMIASLCLIGTLGYLFFFDVQENEKTEKVVKPQEKQRREQENKAERVRFFVCALVGITVFVINWFSALAQGF